MSTSKKMVNRERVAWYGALGALSLLTLGLYRGFEAGSPGQPQEAPTATVLQLEPEELPAYLNPREEQTLVYNPDRTHLSPNYTEGRKGQQIDTIVIHTTEGSGIGAEEWLNNPEANASAHYLIMEDGETVRLVEDQNSAWHVRGQNYHTIGIEFAGCHDQKISDGQIDSGAELIRYLMQEYGLSVENVQPHSALDPARRKDPGEENLNLLLKALE